MHLFGGVVCSLTICRISNGVVSDSSEFAYRSIAIDKIRMENGSHLKDETGCVDDG